MSGMHNKSWIKWREPIFAALASATLFSLSIGTAPTSIFSVMLLVSWILLGGWRRSKEWWVAEKSLLVPLTLFMLLPWMSLLWSIAPSPGLNPYLQRSHFWILALVTSTMVLTEAGLRRLAIALIAGVQINVLLFLFAELGLVIPYQRLYYFMVQGRITYSLLLALSIGLLSFWFSRTSVVRHRIILLIMIGLGTIALAMQTGRTGYLALTAMAPVIAGNLVGWRRWRAMLIVTFIFLATLLLSPAVRERMALIGTESSMYRVEVEKARETGVGARLALWEGGLRIFRKNPVLGVGIDGYPVAMKHLYPGWNSTFANPHNYYLYLAASYGLVGVMLYGWLLVAMFRRGWAARSTWQGFMLLSTLLVISIGSLTESTPLLPQTGILLAMMAGLKPGADDPCVS